MNNNFIICLSDSLSLVAGTKAAETDVDVLLGLKESNAKETKQQIDLAEAKKSLEAIEKEFKVLVADVSARKQLVDLYCKQVKLHETLETKLKRKRAADKFAEENKDELKEGLQLDIKEAGLPNVFVKIPKIDKATKKDVEGKYAELKDLIKKYSKEIADDKTFGTKEASTETVTKLTALGLYTYKNVTTNSEVLANAIKALSEEVTELAKADGKYQVSLATIEALAKESHADLQVLFVLAEKKLALLEKLVEKHDLDPKLFDKSCPAPGCLINHPAGEKETKETTEKKAKKDNVPNTASAAALVMLMGL